MHESLGEFAYIVAGSRSAGLAPAGGALATPAPLPDQQMDDVRAALAVHW